jgi:surface protein
VSRVSSMFAMFSNASAFNQPLNSWDVTNVADMVAMFYRATAFNQPIGSWNVGNVRDMTIMFNGVQLSTANYDELLIGWSTISPNERPLNRNVRFSGGNSKYCNGASARSSIISTYGWTITDGGPDANCVLETETFETNNLKLFPNPVVSVLNINAKYNLINQPYNIIDGLGRVVLNGKLNEVESTINVEQLSKGIYYLKIAGNSATKFIKE